MKIIYGTKVVNGKPIRYHKILENKECEYCGDDFEPKRTDSKYCSRKCGKLAECRRNKERANLAAKKWYHDNKEKAQKTRNAYYKKNIDRERKRKREWNKKNVAHTREQNKFYKDATRHGEMREAMIEKFGLVCSKCGVEKNDRFDIVMHHITFNNKEHEYQELLCRSCHASIHMKERLKL